MIDFIEKDSAVVGAQRRGNPFILLAISNRPAIAVQKSCHRGMPLGASGFASFVCQCLCPKMDVRQLQKVQLAIETSLIVAAVQLDKHWLYQSMGPPIGRKLRNDGCRACEREPWNLDPIYVRVV